MESAIAKKPNAESYDPAQYNILTPAVETCDVPVGARRSLRVVKIDSNVERGEVYRLPGNKLGLGKVALSKLSAAAGISILDVERTDDRSRPHVYDFRARVRVVDMDGLPREGVGTKSVDYSDGGKDSEEIIRKAAKGERDPQNQLLEARKFGAEICASKALNRAIRQILAIKTAYTFEEIAKPYIVPRLILDADDPTAKAALLANLSNASRALYGIEARSSAGPDIEAPSVEKPPEKDTTIADGVRALAKIAEGAGVRKSVFVAICKESTGKASSAELVPEDLPKIEARLSSEIDHMNEEVEF
jgi:hypothetical protein